MVRSFLFKLAMLTVAAGLVLWIGWPLPQPHHPDGVRTDPSKRSTVVTASSQDDALTPSTTSLPPTTTRAHPVPPRTGEAKVDLNRATAQELQQLPGIGPVLAKRIVEHRTNNGFYRSVHELLEVKGIGQKRMARMRPMVLISKAPAPTGNAMSGSDPQPQRGQES